MIKKPLFACAVLYLLLPLMMSGCGGSGGSGGSSGTPSPSAEVLPSSYEFGTVTPNNTPAPLEVRIKNNGNAALQVSSIALSDQTNFSLNTNGGSKPCGSGSPTIPAADSCTFEVGFQPAAGDATFAATVQISSNDSRSPFGLPISGTAEPLKALIVRINQIETFCPNNLAKAYVSVTDQAGFPVTGLTSGNFIVTEGGTGRPITTATYVGNDYEKIAIAAALDYSGSLTAFPESVADMEAGFINLFNDLTPSDIGAVIKFDSEVEVVQPFTSDKAALEAAISAAYDKGIYTRLYDAVAQATDEAALKIDYRRAVIVATDGKNDIDPNGPPSINTLDSVINNAITKGVPIFVVGIGNDIDTTVLTRMANRTGGLFYEAQVTQNLATIYRQLSSLVYSNQYILTFDQLPLGGAGRPGTLKITATSSALSGEDEIVIISCN